MKILYFARLRETIGTGEEDVTPPSGVTDIPTLIDWLKSRGATYDAAFCNPRHIRVAIDQAHARADASIAGAREIAFFPPVTGG